MANKENEQKTVAETKATSEKNTAETKAPETKATTASKAKSQATSLEDATKFSDDPARNEDVKLSKEEQTAIEVQQQVTAGEPYGGKFKLKDPEKSYSEPGFTLAEDQEKELPEDPSPELLARIRSGFIVKA